MYMSRLARSQYLHPNRHHSPSVHPEERAPSSLAMASPAEAEEIVRRLTGKWGYLDETMMKNIEQWNPEYRHQIDTNWLALESAAAHSVKT